MKSLLGRCGAAALLMLISTPAAAVSAPTPATAKAQIYRPLTLSMVQNLDFGTIVMSGAGTWANEVVSMSQAGVVTCGTGANLTCSGSPQAAKYQVLGTSNAAVTISSPSFNLVNGAATLAFSPNFPTTVTLGPAGPVQGVTFSIGGSITLTSSTPDGVYTGTFAVTANYQ